MHATKWSNSKSFLQKKWNIRMHVLTCQCNWAGPIKTDKCSLCGAPFDVSHSIVSVFWRTKQIFEHHFFCCVPSSFLRVCWLFFSLCRCDSIVCFRMKWYSIVFRPIILIRTRACGWYFQAAFRFCVCLYCIGFMWNVLRVNGSLFLWIVLYTA